MLKNGQAYKWWELRKVKIYVKLFQYYPWKSYGVVIQTIGHFWLHPLE